MWGSARSVDGGKSVGGSPEIEDCTGLVLQSKAKSGVLLVQSIMGD